MTSASLRAIPADMASVPVARIDALLDRIVEEHDVRIPLAVESGSRAWGFASPDSDYDCRFVYARPIAAHLALRQPRDVIEAPIDGLLDVNGWDLRKAIGLLLGGNAVIIEWLRAPIVYRGDAWFRDAFEGLARGIARRDAIARHYLHLGRRQQKLWLAGGESVVGKKVFYALRPATTLRWLRMHPGEAVAPMHLPTLLAEVEMAATLAAEIDDLIALKAQTRELGDIPVPLSVVAFISAELDAADALWAGSHSTPAQQHIDEAERFYRATIERLDR